jgi:hypothetical protein
MTVSNISQEVEPEFTSDERKAMRAIIKSQDFNTELWKKISSADKVTASIIKWVMVVISFYVWGIDFLKHALGIQK